jgi:hypothetical protein
MLITDEAQTAIIPTNWSLEHPWGSALGSFNGITLDSLPLLSKVDLDLPAKAVWFKGGNSIRVRARPAMSK